MSVCILAWVCYHNIPDRILTSKISNLLNFSILSQKGVLGSQLHGFGEAKWDERLGAVYGFFIHICCDDIVGGLDDCVNPLEGWAPPHPKKVVGLSWVGFRGVPTKTHWRILLLDKIRILQGIKSQFHPLGDGM